jgi:hypothetical protein
MLGCGGCPVYITECRIGGGCVTAGTLARELTFR